MRIGIDLGGTKIEGLVMDDAGVELARLRVPTPRDDYAATLVTLCDLVERLESMVGTRSLPVGMGTPGSASSLTGLMKNCNSVCLNHRPLEQDLAARLQRPLRIANDANCFALSEAVDGAGRDASVVFGAILGTGVGGGLVVRRQLLSGVNGIGGEWGHNPLPGIGTHFPEERRTCYCGRVNCVETFLCGEGLVATYSRSSQLSAQEIATRAEAGDEDARHALERYAQQLAYALATVINLIDPDVIVLGGGLSRIEALYTWVPQFWSAHVFNDQVLTRLVPARYGDASGVRGAAWLWPLPSQI